MGKVEKVTRNIANKILENDRLVTISTVAGLVLGVISLISVSYYCLVEETFVAELLSKICIPPFLIVILELCILIAYDE